MSFLQSVDEYLESNPFFSLERNFEVNLKVFQDNNSRENKSYEDYLKEGFVVRTDNFYSKFIFLNEYLARCESNEEFKKIILSCFEFIEEDSNYLLHNYLLHFFSITNNEILEENLNYFENNLLNSLQCGNYKDISSINSLIFTYLVLLYHLGKGGVLGVFKHFVKAYSVWYSSFWKDCKLEQKKNYGIIRVC